MRITAKIASRGARMAARDMPFSSTAITRRSVVVVLFVAAASFGLLSLRRTISGKESGARNSSGVKIVVEGNSADPYLQPMCDATGRCFEDPDEPSPRTVYSAKSRDQHDRWWEAHAALNRSAATYAARRLSQKKGVSGAEATTTTKGGGDGRRTESAAKAQSPSRPLVLVGDSITESWLGTDMGRRVPRADGVPSVLKETLSPSTGFDPLVLAIGGDQTQHVLWRMQHGEFLPGFVNDPSAVFVLLIGTNNLGSGFLPGPTVEGILSVVTFILENAAGRLALMELLPRGDSHRLPKLCPPRCSDAQRGKPFRSFMPAVKKVNEELRDAIPTLAKKYGDDRVALLDCGSPFLTSKKGRAAGDVMTEEVNGALMPDKLHPNADGHRILANCISGYIDRMR